MPESDYIGGSENAPRRVIAVSSFFPIPEDRGDPVRVSMFLQGLASASDLTLLVVRRPDTSPLDIQRLKELLPRADVLHFPPPKVGNRPHHRAARWIRALVTGSPAWVQNRRSRELADRLSDAVNDADSVYFLGEAAGTYVRSDYKAHRHWDKSNVLGASTALDVSEARAGLPWLRASMISLVSRRYERRVLQAIDGISVTSDTESSRLQSLYGRRPDVVLPSAVQAPSWLPGYDSSGPVVLWLGSLRYASNLAGLDRFVHEGLDVLISAGLRLRVVGSGASDQLAARLSNTPGIEFAGYVADLGTCVQGARAGIVPLWSGAGIKLKSLTMLAYGLPVASTEIGWEGIPLAAALKVSDDSRSLASAVANADQHVLRTTHEASLLAIQAGGFTRDGFCQTVSTLVKRDFTHSNGRQ
jgi:glycosyltransferase involved in cell wall biosynthesis